jgi:ABC-type antimicrobial peptide transport system permease subunit
MESLVSGALGPRRSAMTLLGTFAGLALFLAAFGIYSVISYSVMQRTPEIGVRVALGARPADLLGLILKQGLALALVGAVAGILGARAFSNLMTGLVYGIEPTDVATIATVSAALIAVSLLACYVPARRAMLLDAVAALRRE